MLLGQRRLLLRWLLGQTHGGGAAVEARGSLGAPLWWAACLGSAAAAAAAAAGAGARCGGACCAAPCSCLRRARAGCRSRPGRLAWACGRGRGPAGAEARRLGRMQRWRHTQALVPCLKFCHAAPLRPRRNRSAQLSCNRKPAHAQRWWLTASSPPTHPPPLLRLLRLPPAGAPAAPPQPLQPAARPPQPPAAPTHQQHRLPQLLRATTGL